MSRSPSSTDAYLYDGEGNRVAQQIVSSGTTTGSTTTTTTCYCANGQRIALAVNGTLSYLASDLLGSATVALNASGLPIASQLYSPYGTVRYQNGSMPTDYGFTGQRAGSATGLDYYGARYYDPVLGQFTSADTVADGLNRYGYVKGNPETLTDPTGHRVFWGLSNTLETIGTTFLQGVPKGIQYLYQVPALKIANKGLNTAGQKVAAQTKFTARGQKIRKLLDSDEFDYKSGSYKAGSRVMRQVDAAVDDARLVTGEARFWSKAARVGGWLMIGISAVVDYSSTYSDYVSSHSDDPNADTKGKVYGALHAGLSTGLGIAGAIVGGLVPVPGLDIALSIGLGAAGSALGDLAADGIENWVDSGGAQQTWNTITGWL